MGLGGEAAPEGTQQRKKKSSHESQGCPRQEQICCPARVLTLSVTGREGGGWETKTNLNKNKHFYCFILMGIFRSSRETPHTHEEFGVDFFCFFLHTTNSIHVTLVEVDCLRFQSSKKHEATKTSGDWDINLDNLYDLVWHCSLGCVVYTHICKLTYTHICQEE